MTRILTIIALLFATPVWANSATASQPDTAAYAAQVNEKLQKIDEVEKKIALGGLVFLLIAACLSAIVGFRQPHRKHSNNPYVDAGGDGGGD